MNSTAATRAALTHRLGLDQPWPVQYFDWIKSTVQGDFGISISRQTPVRALVFSALGNTMILAFAGAVVAFVGGILLGLWSALRRNHATGRWPREHRPWLWPPPSTRWPSCSWSCWW